MSDELPPRVHRITVRALLLGDRIETAGLERTDVLSRIPLTFRTGKSGIVALFRYGVAVLVGMSPLEEDELVRQLNGRIIGPTKLREEEVAQIDVSPDKDDQLTATGIIVVGSNDRAHAADCRRACDQRYLSARRKKRG
jgi:uncharacterized Rmd1/YagE family protein